MKLFKKKSFLISIAASLLLVLFMMPGFKANAEEAPIRDTSKVQLYFNDIEYGMYSTTDDDIYVKVSKTLKNPVVKVEHKSADYNGKLLTTEGTYLKDLDNDYAIYKVRIVSQGKVEYNIIVNSEDGNYIDNYNGKPYTNDNKLGACNVAARRGRWSNYNKYTINASIKDLAYDKDVKVRYTMDNWKTFKEADLKYVSTYEDGIEDWTAEIDFDLDKVNADDFAYAISYTVNGETYWDNNFGSNYKVDHISL